jgi:hypothetical protein
MTTATINTVNSKNDSEKMQVTFSATAKTNYHGMAWYIVTAAQKAGLHVSLSGTGFKLANDKQILAYVPPTNNQGGALYLNGALFTESIDIDKPCRAFTRKASGTSYTVVTCGTMVPTLGLQAFVQAQAIVALASKAGIRQPMVWAKVSEALQALESEAQVHTSQAESTLQADAKQVANDLGDKASAIVAKPSKAKRSKKTK